MLFPALVNLVFFFYARFVVDYEVPRAAFIGFNVANEALMALLYVLWGPLVYDYIPSNRYGTVSAGFSFISGVTSFVLINGAGLWVKGFTHVFGSAGQGRYDHSSGFVWQFALALVALAIALWFGREVKRGHVIAYAHAEFEAHDPAAIAGKLPEEEK